MRIGACAVVILLLSCAAAQPQQKRRSADPFRRFVTDLPAIDRVEVEKVSAYLTDDPKSVDCTHSDMICAPGKLPLKRGEVKSLIGEDAERLSMFWRKLKRNFERVSPYRAARCFVPDHILRFYQGDKLVLETEACVFCQLITLPHGGVIDVSGSMEQFYHLQDILMPDSKIEEGVEEFKREMMPKVGQRLTVIGFFGGGKPAEAVSFDKGGIYINSMSDSEANYLFNLGCRVIVKVTGTLRFWKSLPQKADGVVQQTSPDHFYFDDAEIKVLSYEPLRRSKRSKMDR